MVGNAQMTDKKIDEQAKSIEQYKEQDAKNARKALLKITKSTSAKDKDKVEAWKLLMRMHKQLQPEKVTVKASAIAQQAQQIQKPGISPELQAKLDKLKTNVE